MRNIGSYLSFLMVCSASLALCSCSSMSSSDGMSSGASYASADFSSRLPSSISSTGKKVVLVDPNVHAWGAYENGQLVRSGQASAGSDWCSDLGRRCHTAAGTFHINSLGSANCKSTMFPIPRGGAPMPYCMFFNRNEALHGVPEGEVGEGNFSHGCVRLHVADAEWLRFNFATIGTTVIVKPY